MKMNEWMLLYSSNFCHLTKKKQETLPNSKWWKRHNKLRHVIGGVVVGAVVGATTYFW